ncbi:hTAFII28-like protein conserved region-domain-containing protein [Chlamydoabsidia padenii]|nr:hTAFII28-like protein conserved region-domain-containing protein [Chlamydoabsidia padenii]
MLPTKRSLQYPSNNSNKVAYSPPYDNNYPQKRSTSRRSSATRLGSVETDRPIDDDSSLPSSQLDNTQTTTGSSQDTTAIATTDVANDKDDGDPEEDDKDELVMDDDMHAQMEKVKEDMKYLLENFSEDQLHRYEAYRRSALNRTNVKRLVSQVMNQQCSQTMAFVVAGFSKVYVGEIVEKAREVMEEWGQTGAIRPEHIREAHRRYKLASSTATIGKKMLKR